MTVTTHALVHGEDLLDAAEVGNKFARLESMRRAGFPVPPLFCVSAGAFDVATREVHAGLPAAPAVTDADGVRAWSSAAGTAVADLRVPDELAERALAGFDEVVGPGGLAAVRACVVAAPGQPGEDDVADPYAGMSDSFLYVPRDDLLTRIVACWASAYKPEAVLYRLRRGGDPTAARVAVGIQRMALGTRSFVVFTRDPRDGGHRHVIAAAHGIGEGVVQEKADVDHFFVRSDTGEHHAEVTHKRRMLGPPSPDRPHEPALLRVPAELSGTPVLDDRQIDRIVEVATRIERHFEHPQDIEGTITPDGVLHVVQARPMVLPSTAQPPRVSWSNHNITESYPGVSSALTYSVARDFYRSIFTDVYRRMGVPEGQLRNNAPHLHRMIGMLDGRVFYRLDAWYALHGQMPVFEFIRGWWEHGMGLADSTRSDPLRPGWRRRGLRMAPGLARRILGHPRAVRDFLRWWDETAATATDVIEGSEPAALVDLYRRLWAQVGAHWGVTLTNTIYSVLVGRTLDSLLRRWAGPEGHTLLIGLLSGGPENRSLAALRSAIALAELVNADDSTRDAVLAADQPATAQAMWDGLVAGRYGAELARACAEHLCRYGDRAPGDLKLEEPTPRQRPWMVLEMVRPFVRQRKTVATNRAEEQRVREEAERDLRRRCRNPVRRMALRWLAAAMRRLVKGREDTRFCRSELYGRSRAVLFRLGTELAATGHLDHRGDVVDLTVHEVLEAFEGTLGGSDLRPLVAHRRAERERYAALAAPPSRQMTAVGVPLATPQPEVTVAEPGDGDSRLLRGLASSTGVVRARARVVLEPSSVSAESCVDTVLVARETDPGWLFLMTVAKGMVVERGTLLSHTAITGRLLGVPTVVAVAGATTRISDGAWVELDGASGTVRLLEDGPQ